MGEMDRRGIKLIITVDNGVSSHAAVDRANVLGIDVIVTDHHQITQRLPKACAVINPHRRDSQYPFKEISGAGVAFKFMMGMRKALRESGYFKGGNGPHLKQYVDLVALATVCDVVPLLDENRYFVKEGLKTLAHTRQVGLAALIKVCGIAGRTPTVTDLGFRLGPRLNACGRLEGADLGVTLLTTTDPKQAEKIAQELDRLNQERQAVEKDIVQAVFEQIEKSANLRTTLGLVVFDPDWHEGVVGIVASRVVEKYRRPTFVLSRAENGFVKGSGRSVSSVNLIHAVAQCSDLLEKYGGHEMAAGISLKEENLKAFTNAFDQAVKRQMSFEDLKSVVPVDDVLETSQINEDLMKELSLLEPYGLGNPRPVFVSGELAVRSKRVVGQNHLKMFVGDAYKAFDAIAFDQGDRLDALGTTTRLLFQLEKNSYQNVERIQMNVRGIVE
jgi:single-stranded-DNA-specific exonuclease